MSRLKRIIIPVGLVILMITPLATTADISRVFAACVGRLSAETEHAWLVGNPTADEYADQKMTFLSLMEASMPQEQARSVLSFRIEVKVAHASLLTQAEFGTDPQRAVNARALAYRHLRGCYKLLLDS